MNTFTVLRKLPAIKTGAALLVSVLLLTACAVAPTAPSGAVDVRTKLTSLQSNPEMVRHARVELRDAEEAVKVAEQPLDKDQVALGQHRVYMADRMVEIARAKASTRLAEANREQMGEQRDASRLSARTREADQAHADALALRKQIQELEATATERGLVLTLGDVLFATGSAEIQGGSNQNLEKLVSFLNQYPDRNVLIEGHTDNVGSAALNQRLSQQRADSVRRYLIDRGVEGRRLTASGVGFDRPIAGNDTATGRQQNRRVEVIIENKE